jgi:hypothetical protein
VSDLAGEALRRALPDNLGRIAKLIDDSGIPLEEIARIDRIRVGTYQTAVKVKDGDGVERIEQITNAADSITLVPTWADGPAWPVVQPVAPVRVPASRAKPVDDDLVRCVFLPDTQIGFHDLDGELVPMHDPAAMTVAVEIVRQVRPDVVVVLGDLLDLGAWSLKFARTPQMARTSQASIDAAHTWLAQVRAAAPHADVHLLAGNHDDRVPKLLAANAAEAFGLRRANTPESWPVLSVPYLCRLDDLAVAYVGGYPAGKVWLRDDVVAHHGKHVSAHKQSRDRLLASTFQGHTHRLEVVSRTHEGPRGVPVHTVHVACGTLARIDGTVPSFGSATDDAGAPVPHVEDWVQGVVVATWDPNPGTLPAVELIPIQDGSAWFRGRRLTTQQETPSVQP